MQISNVFVAVNIAAAILAMILIYLVIDIQSRRVIEREGKRRLIDREFAKKLVPINKTTEEKLELKLKQAEITQSVHDFVLKAVINGCLGGVVALIVTQFFLPTYVSIILTIAIIGVAIYLPISEISGRIKALQLKRAAELPRYIKTLIILLKTQTTYDAIKKSVDYATPAIKPYAKQLLIEINQYPNSSIPFDNFARNINVKQARQFMNLLYQSLDLSQKTSIEFMEKLKEMSDLLEEESTKKMSLQERKAMEKYNKILFICLLVLPLSLVAVVFLDAMKKLM